MYERKTLLNLMDKDYSEKYLRKILMSVKTIAIVGASNDPERDSYKVMKDLIKNGFKVFPVNPNLKDSLILNRKCYPDLISIKEQIDMVDIFRNIDAIMGVTEEAIKVNAKILWMQLDIIHEKAAKIAEKSGMKVVMNRCPKIELSKPYWTSKIK